MKADVYFSHHFRKDLNIAVFAAKSVSYYLSTNRGYIVLDRRLHFQMKLSM